MLGHCAQSVGGALPGGLTNVLNPEYVGASQASANNIVTPPHQLGDLLILIAGRQADSVPSLPTGWTQLEALTGGPSNERRGLLVASKFGSGVQESVQSLNAYQIAVVVYRKAKVGRTANRSTVGLNNNPIFPAVEVVPARSRTMIAYFAPVLSSFQTHRIIANGMAATSNGLLDEQTSASASISGSGAHATVTLEIAAND